MPLAPRAAAVSLALALTAAACGAANDRNSRLGTGNDTCLDIDSDCPNSHECCSGVCANGTCVKRER
jgi:hypothetical protein